jgi:hypothetical protein
MLGVCTGKPHWKQQQVTWQSIASIYWQYKRSDGLKVVVS